ncbi:hypothetical protein [Enterobacter mori]|uniref:hypothetical protein n=1 Tax=Enterobacter mori TaxID=539813 RepID=UPI002FD552F0
MPLQKDFFVDLFPDIEQAVPLPHEEVLRYMVCKIRDNRSEEWLTEMCRKNNLSDVCQDFLHKGVLKALEGEPEVSFYPPRLTIELVPRTCWFDNVRSAVSSTDWKRLRQQTSRTAGWKCQICGGKGPRWPVECHEIWHYDDGRHDLFMPGNWISRGSKRRGIKRQDETAAEGDNIPAENQLSLELEVPPVETESTAVPAVGEQGSISGDVRQIPKDNPVSRSSSVVSTFWLVCQRVFCKVKKVIREQW